MSNHLNKLDEKKYAEIADKYSKKSSLLKDCTMNIRISTAALLPKDMQSAIIPIIMSKA